MRQSAGAFATLRARLAQHVLEPFDQLAVEFLPVGQEPAARRAVGTR